MPYNPIMEHHVFTRGDLTKAAMRLYDFCAYPAVKYAILYRLLDRPYDDQALTALRPAFLASDIVEELYREQDNWGGWGRLLDKDYSAKDRFPTSQVAINRCLYIVKKYADNNRIS